MRKVLLDSISQVISGIILAFLGVIVIFIVSQITDKPFQEVFNEVMTFNIPVYNVLLIIIVFILITSLINFIRSKSEPSEVKYLKRKIKAFVSDGSLLLIVIFRFYVDIVLVIVNTQVNLFYTT